MPTRDALKANVNRFVNRYGQMVTFKTYRSSLPPAIAPYSQRIRQYEAPVQVKCLVKHHEREDELSDIGNALLNEFEICTGPDQLLDAFQPGVNDPRVLRDPSTLVTSKDIVEIDGTDYRIYSKTAHGDDGGGPLWYIFSVRKEL